MLFCRSVRLQCLTKDSETPRLRWTRPSDIVKRLMTRHLIALALAAAVGTGPMVMNLCAESCEATHAARAATAAPACHHSTTQTPRLETIPVACGHDHSGTTMAVAGD